MRRGGDDLGGSVAIISLAILRTNERAFRDAPAGRKNFAGENNDDVIGRRYNSTNIRLLFDSMRLFENTIFLHSMDI